MYLTPPHAWGTPESDCINIHVVIDGVKIRFVWVLFGFSGPIPENEDRSLSLLGLHGNWIQCQTPLSPLYHRSNCGLSAHHHILVNLSLGEVTMRRFTPWIHSLKERKDNVFECLYACVYKVSSLKSNIWTVVNCSIGWMVATVASI